MIKKHQSPSFIAKYIFIVCILYSIDSQAQVEFGLKKLNVWTELAFASPKQEMKNSYSYGEPMKLYLGADLPFAFLQYSKKRNTGLSVGAFLDHEKANFTDDSYATDGLNAKMTSVGVRVRPFGNMAIYQPKGSVTRGQLTTITTHKVTGTDEFGNRKYSEYTTTESTPLWSDEGAKLLVTMFLSGLYFDYGVSHLALIEPPTPDVKRTAVVYSYGCAPSLAVGRKLTFFMDFSIRKYQWTNKMNTTSGIKSFHTGFGLGFNL
jgi:hypothetical protein